MHNEIKHIMNPLEKHSVRGGGRKCIEIFTQERQFVARIYRTSKLDESEIPKRLHNNTYGITIILNLLFSGTGSRGVINGPSLYKEKKSIQ